LYCTQLKAIYADVNLKRKWHWWRKCGKS